MKIGIFAILLAMATTAVGSTHAFAANGKGVNLFVATDKDSYDISSLVTVPIIVTMYLANETNDTVVVTETPTKVNSYAQFGHMEIRPTQKVEGPKLCSYCTVIKGVAFKPAETNLAYKDVTTPSVWLATVNTLLGAYVFPHERIALARAEIYLNSFFVPSDVKPGVYEVSGELMPNTLWNKTANQVLPDNGGLSRSVGTRSTVFIRLK